MEGSESIFYDKRVLLSSTKNITHRAMSLCRCVSEVRASNNTGVSCAGIARWVECLMDYLFVVEHLKRVFNTTDRLLRMLPPSLLSPSLPPRAMSFVKYTLGWPISFNCECLFNMVTGSLFCLLSMMLTRFCYISTPDGFFVSC